MRTLTVVLPLPHRKLSPNYRYGHWSDRSKATRKARTDAGLAATAAIRAQHVAVPFEHPALSIVYYHRRAGSRDQQNLLAWLKAAIDGLQDAGVAANDRDFRFIMPIKEEVDPANPRVEIAVSEGEDGPQVTATP